jgi:hypothetical protein
MCGFRRTRFTAAQGGSSQVEAVRFPIGRERFDEVTAMNRRPLPADQQTAGHLAQQVFQKGDDICGIDGIVLAMKMQLAIRRDSADGREVIARPPLPGMSVWPVGAQVRTILGKG